MTIIMVEDPHIGGYTAFLKELPNIVTEGETVGKAQKNLADAIWDVVRVTDVKVISGEILI